MSSGSVLHFYLVPLEFSKGVSSYRADTKSIKKGDNSKSKKTRLVILVSTRHPVLFYISSKYHRNIPRNIQLTERHEIYALSLSNITKGDNAKERKVELSFLYATHRLILFFISTKYHQNIPKSIRVTERHEIYFSQNKGNKSKSKKARAVIFVHDKSSCPVLQFYQVSSKYSKGYSSYRADKSFTPTLMLTPTPTGSVPKNNMHPHQTHIQTHTRGANHLGVSQEKESQ